MPATQSALRKAVADRCARLRKALAESPAEALLVTAPADVGYLSGFTGEDSWLVIGKGRGWVITDGRFAEEVERECPDFSATIRKGPMIDALAKAVHRKRIGCMAYDPGHVSVALLARLRRGLKGVRLVKLEGAVTGLRARKDQVELRMIRRAVQVAEEGWRAFRARIRLGMTEQALAADLDYQMRLAGADAPAFRTIVGIDGTAARPHALPGRRRLKRGSVLLVDFGARVDGYVCDLTRVLFAGRIPRRARRVYEVVYAAQAAGIAAVGPGVKTSDVDAAARVVIEEAGYGKEFRHGTGHGLGREVHEEPRLGPHGPTSTLEAGMVVTIEPGIYLKGRLGVRLEDDVLVTSTGRRVLTHVEKDPDAIIV